MVEDLRGGHDFFHIKHICKSEKPVLEKALLLVKIFSNNLPAVKLVPRQRDGKRVLDIAQHIVRVAQIEHSVT